MNGCGWLRVDRFFVAWQHCHGSSTNQDMHALGTFYSTLPDTRECLHAQNLGILGPLRESQVAIRLPPRGATGLPSAFCRCRVAQPPPGNSSTAPALPPHTAHRSPSWHVRDVVFARYVSAGCLGVSVAVGGGLSSVATRVLDTDVDMTRRAVPIAPECMFVSVFVLRCVLAPAIRRAGTATPDRPECPSLSSSVHNLLEHRRPRKDWCGWVGCLSMMDIMTRMVVISRYL